MLGQEMTVQPPRSREAVVSRSVTDRSRWEFQKRNGGGPAMPTRASRPAPEHGEDLSPNTTWDATPLWPQNIA
jgi:hypothetical protein